MAVGAVQHRLGGPALEVLVVAERDRVARLARVRELILIAQDALFLSLAVVTGIIKARVARVGLARNGAEAALCAAAAGAGYLVGWLGEAWVT